MINEVALRQDAGWAGKSQMHLKYVHYYGNEASNAILKARGIIPDNQQQDTRLLSKPKECPNCSELNDPLGKFCIRCKMVLRYEGYAEALEAGKKKDQEIDELKEQTQIMSKQLADVIEQQQQHANTFDMKFVKLLNIVKSGLVDQDQATRSFISGEIVKMMPRKLTTKEIESRRNLTGVFIDSMPD